MRKYEDLILKLTTSQKVRMLTSSGNLSGKDMKILGIPEINAGDMKDYGRALFPNATALVHSWNKELWREVAGEKTDMLLRDGKNLAITPGPKIKISPFRREISEDPCLAAEMAAAHLEASSDKGVVAAEAGLYLTRADVKWLDERVDDRVIHEFVTAPFANALPKNGVRAVATDVRDVGREYYGAARLIGEEMVKYADYIICKNATDENTVDLIARGVICLEGSDIALESAIARYKKIKRSIENNEGATEAQLEEELERRTAISPDTVDDALENLLSFMYTVAESGAAAGEESLEKETALSVKAAVDSSVLLKNEEEILPLEYGERISIIGDIAFSEANGISIAQSLAEALTEKGYKVSGTARGYNMADQRDGSLVDGALSLVSKSDTAILFMGFGYEAEKKIPKTETLSLPANQLYLASKILASGKRVIAVISSGHAPDIAFTRDFKAVLLAPLEVKGSAEAIVKMLTGAVSPSGKLAYTLYAGSDGAFMKGRHYRKRYGIKTGPFIGYRYYDTADLTLGYPFGHGLSYARFKYSSLSVGKDAVTFTVKNVSDVAGAETAQLYLGEEKPALITPKKELVGFEKIYLLPGEKKTVKIPLRFPERYVDGKYITPAGTYAVYVGSSVSDIRLRSNITANGPTVEADGARLCDYLQSISNVREDNYTLEANYSVMKKSIRNILFGIAFIVLAISAAVFNTVTEHPSTFVGALAGVLAVVAIGFFISEAAVRTRAYVEERKRINEANREKFDDAEQIPFLSTNKMFHDEFEVEETDAAVSAEIIEEVGEENVSQYIDKEFTLANAVSEFKDFLDSRGYRVENAVAENLLSSLATSRLVVTGAMESELFAGFMRVSSEYFGTDTFIDKAEKKAEGDTSFYSYDYHGDHNRKNIILALEYARENPTKIVLASLDGATVEAIEEYLLPFTKYLYSPKVNNKIVIHGDHGTESTYNIAPNLRFVINLSDRTSLDSLAPHISALAAVNLFAYEKCQVNESFSGVRELNRYQLEYMRDKGAASVDVSEDVWKKVDKIEKYAIRFSEYRIGNKLWLSFEKHIAMLISAGLAVGESLDIAVSSRLVPSLEVALRGNIPEGEQNLPESLEFILGEGNVDFSKRIISKLVFEVEEEELVEEAPAEEAPAEEAPAEEAPAEETPTEEAPTEEAPAEEGPTEEAPAEEAPAEETVEETPTEETASDTEDAKE